MQSNSEQQEENYLEKIEKALDDININYKCKEADNLYFYYEQFMTSLKIMKKENIYKQIINILYVIYNYLYEIVKLNREPTSKFFNNGISLILLMKCMILYETKNFWASDKYSKNRINIKNFEDFFKDGYKELDEIKIQKKEEILKQINKMINKYEEIKNLQLVKIEFDQFLKKEISKINHFEKFKNSFDDYNTDKEYSINDFLLAYVIFNMNINDISYKLSNLYKVEAQEKQEKKEIELYNIKDKVQNENIIKWINYNIFETETFDNLLNYPDFNYNLCLLTLICCKHIVYSKPIELLTPYSFKLLLLNFLAIFEKHINKIINENIKIINENHLNISTLFEKVKFIYESKLTKQYLYDFKFFIDLLYLIINNQNIITKENCTNKKILKVFENNDISQILLLNIKKEDEEKMEIFINIITILLKNNKSNHLFNNFYISSIVTELFGKTLALNELITKKTFENIRNTFYNPNYINFKKPYKFVRDFNNLVIYHNIIFKKITLKDIRNFIDHKNLENTIYERFHSYNQDIGNYSINEYSGIKGKSPFSQTCSNLFENNNYNKNQFFLKLDNTITDEKIKSAFKHFFTKLNIPTEDYIVNDESFVKIPKSDKNILIYIVASAFVKNCPEYSAHFMSVNINFENGYIDFYNPWGYVFNNTNEYANVSKKIKNYFKKFSVYDNEKQKLYQLKLYCYDTMMKTQGEFENKYNGYCELWGNIYNFIRINYFNNAKYSMNYVQEMINEYIQSFNHPLYFLFNFVLFIYLIYCNNSPNKIITTISQMFNVIKTFKYLPIEKGEDNKFNYVYEYLKNPNSKFYEIFRYLIVNPTKLQIINRNYNKLIKSVEIISNNYKNRINTNLNIINNYQSFSPLITKKNKELQNKIFNNQTQQNNVQIQNNENSSEKNNQILNNKRRHTEQQQRIKFDNSKMQNNENNENLKPTFIKKRRY